MIEFLFWRGRAIYNALSYPSFAKGFVKGEREKLERELEVIEKKLKDLAKREIEKE